MILLLLGLLVKSTYVRSLVFFYKFTLIAQKKCIPSKWNALFIIYAFSVLVTIGSMALLFFCIKSARTQATTERMPATKKAVSIP